MVDPKDANALRFLWWPNDDLSKQPVEYRMKVHLFGGTSSPSCASFGLRKNVQDNAGDLTMKWSTQCWRPFMWTKKTRQEPHCWRLWLSDLPLPLSVALPRCLRPVHLGQIQNAVLHYFVDASQIAYGTVSYARLVNLNGRIHCSFLARKSRLAHMKQMTIPRLELWAATLVVRMNQILQEEFQFKFDRTAFWTDWTAFLQYIKNEDNDSTCLWPINKQWYTMVQNFPSGITSNINPADDVSRGLTVKDY